MPTDTIPLKYATRINSTTLPETTDKSFPFLYIDIGSVTAGGHIEMPEDLTCFGEAPSRARRTAPPGAVVVSTVRTYLRAVARVPVSEDPLVFSTGFATLEAKDNLDPGFLAYACRSDSFVDEVVARSVGVSYPAINSSDLAAIRIPLPPVGEQRRIADFLDDQVGRLNAVINLRESQIENLKAAAVSRIQSAVLGRTDYESCTSADGPLLPCPSGWQVRRNRTFIREVAALTETGDEELLTVSHITGVTPRSEKTVTMFEAETNVGYKCVEPEQLVINTMWAWMGALGVSRLQGIVSPAYGVYRFTDENAVPGYFDHLFRSPAYIAEMTRYSKGVWSSRLRLYPDAFLSLVTPFPPRQVQREIAEAADRIQTSIAASINQLDRSIPLMEERKRAVITAAVTGELDVTTARPIGVGKWVPNVVAPVDSSPSAQAQAPSIGGIG